MSVIGLDVGGTKILGAAFDGDREIQRVQVSTPPGVRGGDPGAVATLGVLDQLIAAAVEAGDPPETACIAVPEYVRDGHITSSLVIDWDGAAVDAACRSRGPRFTWASDVQCGALGEFETRTRFGGTRPGAMLYVSLGTGISHAVVVDGKLIVGAHGEAIALGELAAPDDADTIESLCAGAAMLARWQAATGEPIAPEHLFTTTASSSPDQIGFLAATARRLAWAITIAANVIDPDLIVLGGGLGCRPSTYRDLVLEAFRAAGSSRRHPPAIEIAQAGHDAGLQGARLIAQHL